MPAVHVVETIESPSDPHFYALGRDFLPARYFRRCAFLPCKSFLELRTRFAERLGRRAPRASVFCVFRPWQPACSDRHVTCGSSAEALPRAPKTDWARERTTHGIALTVLGERIRELI